jgi:hypothetical protein
MLCSLKATLRDLEIAAFAWEPVRTASFQTDLHRNVARRESHTLLTKMDDPRSAARSIWV